MRLTKPPRFEQIGSVRIHEMQHVLELNAGSGQATSSSDTVSADDLVAVESRMAIIVMCKDEHSNTIESLFSGIPHDCLIVLVSNSSRDGVDRYATEARKLGDFCRSRSRGGVAIHQKDPGVSRALAAAGAPDAVGADGLVRSGKGEGMLIGLALAAREGRDYVGFVDGDNYVPGSVLEYCQCYAAGFHMAEAEDAMVRISWGSKPKHRDGRLMFDREGRSSRVVNEWLNALLQHFSGYGTDCVKTGNAGEHAMSMSLARKMRIAGGFAVEPFEYIHLLERMGGLLPTADDGPEGGALREPDPGVAVYQIRSQSPHIHDDKGDEHVSGMRLQALNMLYHSSITPPAMKTALRQWMENEQALARGETPPEEIVYPALEDLDMKSFYDVLACQTQTLHKFRP